jgi:protein-S-isoprenylcysteine O-methyltransferase
MTAVTALIVALFPLSEIVLAVLKRSPSASAHSEDRGSLRVLWLAIAGGIFLAIVARSTGAARLPGPPRLLRVIAWALLAGGLAVRWTAILTLGRLFTVDVAVHRDHSVVQTGLYRRIRHPSYTGLLVAFLGVGVFFGNWLSLLVLLIPVTLAVINRVATEERALLEALGPEYASYCARTSRFFPGL